MPQTSNQNLSSLQPQLAMNSVLQPQSSMLSGVPLHPSQPAVLTNQFMAGGMQGQLLNSQLLVQPQTSQQPVLLKSQSMTPSKPLISSGKSSSAMMADCTPLHQVIISELVSLMSVDKKLFWRSAAHIVSVIISKTSL